MSEESKDRLEEFFRKSTEKYHFEYSDADWKKLEAKLDEEEKGGGAPVFKRNGMKYYLFGGLLILSLALWFGWNKIGGAGDENVTRQSNAAGTYAQQDVFPEAEREKQAFANRKNRKDLPGKAKPGSEKRATFGEAVVSENKSAANSNVQNAERNESAENSNSFDVREVNIPAAELADKKAPSPRDAVSHTANTPVFFENEGTLYQEKQKAAGKTGALYGTGLQRISSYGIAANDFYALTTRTVPANFTTPPGSNKGEIIERGEDSRRLRRGFSVGFFVAPDFSSVGIGDYTRPGTRYGLLMEYSLSRRFSIRSGAIMADNIYKAEGDEYHPPQSFWSGGDMPETADGQCKIVDIPLNLRYNIAGGDNSGFFVSGGINNYIMLKEKYNFNYADEGYGKYGKKSSWESKKASSHWLGLVNFSVGYERFVAQRWSVQAEPFINFPLTGIGWGNVDLYSLGAYLSLKYHWNKK